MFKRALMLTAAAAALLSGPVLGDDFTDIKTKVTQPVQTSTANNGTPADILIETTGSVVVATAGPAVEIDSPNSVTNQGIISNIGTVSAIGVRLDATAPGNGPGSSVTAFDSTGTIDLSGTGTEKTGILIGIANTDSTGIFNGGINLEDGSKLTVTGDSAQGIYIGSNTTLNGNIDLAGSMSLSGGTTMTGVLIGTSDTATANMVGDLTFEQSAALGITGDGSFGVHIEPNSVLTGNFAMGGSISVAATDPKATTGGNVTGIWVDNNTAGNAITGDLIVGKGAGVTATGANAQGVVLLGSLGGTLENDGNITAVGTTTPLGAGGNPVGGSALVIANSIGAGILNNGPTNPTDTTTQAQINGNGTFPVFLISPTADGATATGDIHIGANVGQPEGDFGLINRGVISAIPANPNQLAAFALRIQGAGTFTTYIDNGLFSSGQISASTVGDDKQIGVLAAEAISIGDSANVPIFFNSNQNSGASGIVSASYTGTTVGGTAFAIHIDGSPTGAHGTLNRIINQGTISAISTISDTTLSNGTATTCGPATALAACAIWDESGTLTEVDNAGTILASATALDDNSQVVIAIDMSNASQNSIIDNSGIIHGDVNLGNGADYVHVHGSSNQPASIIGNISFGGTSNGAGADDLLQIDDHSTVTGNITERAGGGLDVLLNPGGVLTVTNDSIDLDKRFQVNDLTVGAGGTLGLALSQTYNLSVNPTAGGIVTASGDVLLNPQAILSLPFQSFLSGQTPGEASQFVLIDAPLNQLQLSLSALQNQICPTVPFLFENGDQQCLDVNNTTDRSQLTLTLTPKSAQEIGLTGYALKMFPVANLALANDDQLGAAVINAGLPVNGVPLTPAQGQTLYEQIYSQFAPNVTGASRALAIAITDQTSGPVGARQRALRMYAGQPGDTTLWGQEFNLSLNQESNNGTIGYRDTGFGFVVGADAGDPADGRYGGAFSFYTGDIDEKQPQDSKTDSQWAMLTGYTDWRGRGLFLDTQLSAGVGKLDGRRHIDVSGVTRTAEGKRDSLLGAIGATTGVILTTGSTVFTPMFSLDGMYMKENGYTEHGGGDPNGGDGFDLNVATTYYKSARAFLGADVRQDLDLGDFYLQPEARAGYRYDFIADAQNVKASFAQVPGTAFTLTGPDPARGNAVFGGSVAATTGAWSIGLNYDYLRGDDGSISQAGTVTLLGRI